MLTCWGPVQLQGCPKRNSELNFPQVSKRCCTFLSVSVLYPCAKWYKQVETTDNTIKLRYHTGLTRKDSFVQRSIFRVYSDKNNLSLRVTGEQALRSLVTHQNSFEIKQEFRDSTHRKTNQNLNENTPTYSPPTKKYCPRHWELSPDVLNLPTAQRPYKMLWKAQMSRSSFCTLSSQVWLW